MPHFPQVTDSTPFKVVTPIGMLGYGYDFDAFEQLCAGGDISAIIADSGSTDSGPQKLALGSTTCPRDAYLRDLEPILRAAHRHQIPVLIGSAGGDGSNIHVDLFVELVHEISAKEGYSFLVASIYADISPELVVDQITAGTVIPCGPVPELTAKEARKATTIVAQMGAEPFMDALLGGANVIIGGRAYDPAPYAAVCLLRGVDAGVAWHMGKEERCTVISVGAHTLYEKSRPDRLVGPGGILDLTQSKYEQLTERTVRVSGAVFEPMSYTVKLEGAKPIGFRTMFMGGIRDPILIAQIDTVLPGIEKYVQSMTEDFDGDADKIEWHVYGKNGVMGSLEPDIGTPLEICVMGEVLSSTQSRANGMASLARVGLMHCPYVGQMATAGSFASPLTPLEVALGPACEFNVYHIISISDPLSLFPITYHSISYPIGSSAGKTNGDGVVVKTPKTYNRAPVLEQPPKATMAELVAQGSTSATLAELASIVRSKNAGPFELTFDVMFEEESTYQWVKSSGVLNPTTMSAAFNMDESKVVACMFWDQARAFKFTIPRVKSQGGFGERDMHGCQQHIPLMRTSDQRFSYFMHIPKSHTWTGKPLPLVVLIHGTMREAESLRNSYAQFSEDHACVVLVPYFAAGILGREDRDSYKLIAYKGIRFDTILLGMIDEVADVYNFESDKFLLAGFSGGGQFAQRFLYLHPERLRAVSIGAPGEITPPDSTIDWPKGIRNLSELFDGSGAGNFKAMSKVAVQFLVGELDNDPKALATQDGTGRIDRITFLPEALVERGVGVGSVLEVIPGVGHQSADARTRATTQAFLRKQLEVAEAL
ncbi:hypothetical protein RQP46_002404 [Phenoliferia psychrophenolica]